MVCSPVQAHMRCPIGEGIGDLWFLLVHAQFETIVRLLTNIGKVFEDSALHSELVKICIQKREDSLWQRRQVHLRSHALCLQQWLEGPILYLKGRVKRL